MCVRERERERDRQTDRQTEWGYGSERERTKSSFRHLFNVSDFLEVLQ